MFMSWLVFYAINRKIQVGLVRPSSLDQNRRLVPVVTDR